MSAQKKYDFYLKFGLQKGKDSPWYDPSYSTSINAKNSD